MKTPKDASEYIEGQPGWKEQLQTLRRLLTSYPFEETIKWGIPIYTLNNKNLIGLAAFKNHLALWFYQGAMLEKNTELLYNAGENKTKALRQIRFNERSEIDPGVIKKHVEETIELHKQGKELKPEKKEALEVPQILQNEFDKNKDFRKKFYALTPGRRREYCEYIKEAKKEDTRLKRLKMIIPMIDKGRGLNDKYR